MSRSATRLLALGALLTTGSAIAQKPAAGPADSPAATSPAATAARPSSLPPVYDEHALGTKALEWTQEASRLSGRRMFVNLGVNDSEACRQVNAAMHDKKFFEVFIKQFVPVFIDVGPRAAKNRALLKEYGIDATKGFPAVAIFSPEGKLLEVTQKGELAALAGKGQDAIQGWILDRFAR